MRSNSNNAANTQSSRTRPERRARRLAGIALAAVIAAAGCSGDADDASDAPASERVDEPAFDASVDAADRTGEGGANGNVVAPDPGFDIGIVGRDVIIEMRVLMSSDDIERTVSSITASAAGLGGGIASSDVSFGDPASPDQGGYAILVVKVPPSAVDQLLSGLEASGTVRSIQQSAQDVTEQLIDLDVRIANARQSVANVRDFMERAEDLNDLVTLEGELTRRQTELERLEAQQRNLADRVALSTITIEVVPTESVPAPVVDDDGSIGDAFRNGWEAFVTFVTTIAYVVAVILPFLLLGGVIATIAWLFARRRARPMTRTSAPSPTNAESDGPNVSGPSPDDDTVREPVPSG